MCLYIYIYIQYLCQLSCIIKCENLFNLYECTGNILGLEETKQSIIFISTLGAGGRLRPTEMFWVTKQAPPLTGLPNIIQLTNI